MNCSSKLIEPEDSGSLEPLIYNSGLETGVCNTRGRQSCGNTALNLWSSNSVSGQMVSELSQIVGHTAGVTEDSLVWEKSQNTFSDQRCQKESVLYE